MAAHDFSDVNLGISPMYRHMVDQNLPGILTVLEAKTTIHANLPIIMLLANKDVIVYLQNFFGMDRVMNLKNLYFMFGLWYRENQKLFINPADPKLNSTQVFFLGALNFEDYALEYIDNVVESNEEGETWWNLDTVETLLAGAYFGGHDNLIHIIEKRIKGIDDENMIHYAGMVGAICAGRYHYVAEKLAAGHLKQESDELISDSCYDIIRDHFIPTKANAKRALVDQPLPGQQFFNKIIYTTIFERGDDETKLWFFTSSLACTLKFEDITGEGWLFIGRHKDQVVLSDELMAEIEDLNIRDLSILMFTINVDTNYLKAMFKEGNTKFVRYMTWALRLRRYNVVVFIADFLRSRRIKSDVFTDPHIERLAIDIAEGKMGEPSDSFYWALYRRSYRRPNQQTLPPLYVDEEE